MLSVFRVGNTKHENFVFRVYRYKHENPKYKHETNTRKVKTRKIGKFKYTPRPFKFYHSPLRSRLSPIQFETLMIVSSNEESISAANANGRKSLHHSKGLDAGSLLVK